MPPVLPRRLAGAKAGPLRTVDRHRVDGLRPPITARAWHTSRHS